MNSILYIYSKKTDANASSKGYQYQILKTLEIWIDNYLRSIDEQIYCDYEDDVFQNNQLTHNAKFRQIKLYSSSFSFNSEEITKAIAHFFMLHVKTDYESMGKEFVFETNASIARNYSKNDADLLKRWHEHQDHLSDELACECAKKVKSIVSEYINDQSTALIDKVDKSILAESLDAFSKISSDSWVDFIKKIKWVFLSRSVDEEFTSLKKEIDSKLLKLPFPIEERNLSAIFGLLHNVICEKAGEKNPDDRRLSLEELERHLLESGTEEDKWYSDINNNWKDIDNIEEFLIGEFFEIIDAIRYCRTHTYLSSNDSHWLILLNNIISSGKVENEFNHTAIYECLWLKCRMIDPYIKPAGDLFGYEKYFTSYFEDFSVFSDADRLEKALSLMLLAKTSCILRLSNLKHTDVSGWFRKLNITLKERIKEESNINEKCQLLENLGILNLHLNQKHRKNRKIENVLAPLNLIIPMIDKALLFNVSKLSFNINSIVKVLIHVDPIGNSELIESLDLYSQKIDVFVQERDGHYQAAKIQVDRGCEYLQSDNPVFLLKALTCFHKAKDLFYSQEYLEGFVLALLNISQLYYSIGMNLASKYYGLCGAWMGINNGKPYLLRRIADSLGLIFNADFHQGAWINSITDFADYFNAYHEFTTNPIESGRDEMPIKIITDFSLVLFAIPKISEKQKILIDIYLPLMGNLGDQYILPLIKTLENKYPTQDSVIQLLERKLTDKPLNDAGEIRYIKFNAFGSLWEVSFENNYITNSIAEEFCSVLQIILVEIALSKYDFHFVRGTIKIELEIGDDKKRPDQLPTHDEFRERAFISYFDSTISSDIDLNTIRKVQAIKFILGQISLLPTSEYNITFESLFKDNALAHKTLTVNAYQKMYRLVFSEERFNRIQRHNYQQIEQDFNLPKENIILKWKNDISEKYNHDEAIEHIKNRFRHAQKSIHITIFNLKKDALLPQFINRLRSQGYLDWQIVQAMRNYIVNWKANRELATMSFSSQEEQQEMFNRLNDKYLFLDEADCYVDFPLRAFDNPSFYFQLKNYFANILESFNLENGAKHPNFDAIKEFLDIRFNMKNDITDEGNPLQDIAFTHIRL